MLAARDPPRQTVLQAFVEPSAYFAEKNWHQPLGLMVPCTNWHASGGAKLLHKLQCWSPFGMVWYIASACLKFGWASERETVPAAIAAPTRMVRRDGQALSFVMTASASVWETA